MLASTGPTWLASTGSTRVASTGPMRLASQKVWACPLLYIYWPALVLQSQPVTSYGCPILLTCWPAIVLQSQPVTSSGYGCPILLMCWPVLILQCWPPIIYGHVSCYFDTGQYWSYGSGRLISRDHGPGTWILASTCSTCLASHNLWTSPILLRYWPVLGLRGWPVTLPPPSYSLLIITVCTMSFGQNGPTGWPVHCLHEFSTVGQPPAAHIVRSFGTSRVQVLRRVLTEWSGLTSSLGMGV
jgi:hypothetical protein